MSIPVDLSGLDAAVKEYAAGYLVTVSDEGTAKIVTVEPTVTDGVVRVADPGNGSRRNAAANPRVTLVFPPREEKGFTLLVDGTAAVEGDDVTVVPTWAVLHRPAMHADGPPPPLPVSGGTACGNDCRPVG